jgi:hypothetical protein
MKTKSGNIPRSTAVFITVLLILFAIVTALRGDPPLPGVKQEQQAQTARLCVHKFYDANANGVFDAGDQEINGWKFQLFAGDNLLSTRETTRCMTVDPDTYHVVESDSLVSSWVHTTATNVVVSLAAGETQNVWFGNVCLGPGGGLTLGFWSNKDGQNLETSADFTFLNTLNIVQANGSLQRFTGSLTNQKSQLNTWLLNASATNMAYVLSTQFVAMELNVRHSYVSGNARVYAPNLLPSKNPNFPRTPGLNSLGFISINNLMSVANTILIAPDKYTVAAGTLRSYEEVLKTALDNANNNLNFVQPSPCSMSFAPLPP